MYLDLSLIKNHLNVEEAFTEDDVYIMQLAEAAIETTKRDLDIQSIDEIIDDEGQIKAGLRHAILLLIGHWYAQRETARGGVMQRVPYAWEFLCDQYRNYKKH